MKTVQEVERFYEMRASCRVRIKKGALRDEIRPGVISQDLEREGLSVKDLKHAIRQGWIIKEQIREHGSILNVYVFTGMALKQASWWKRIIDKIIRFLPGN